MKDSGTRLLCNQRHLSQHVVINLPMRHHQQPSAVNGKVVLKANDFRNRNVRHNQAYCFAGTDDELVISASDDHHLFIWSLPSENDDGQDRTVDQSLNILQGHTNIIRCIRYNKEQSAIASCGDVGVIKLWTSRNSKAPQ